jgi:hypothetical protein
MLLYYAIPLILALTIGTFTTVQLGRRKRADAGEIPRPRLSKRSDRKHKQLPALLLAWAEQRDRHGVGAWLQRLSVKELKLLTKDVAVFTRDMGFDLLWVVDQQIDEVNLRDEVGHMVFSYIEAFYRAAILQDDMHLYVTLVDFLNNLSRRRYQAQAQAVFKQLIDDGVIPRSSAELIFARKSKRIKHVEQAILQAAQSDRTAVKLAVHNTFIRTRSRGIQP